MTTSPESSPGQPQPDTAPIWAWFAGPKAENADWFEKVIVRLIQDYYAWRRNYFPEDGVIVDSALKRRGEAFRDQFEDRLLELLGRLKCDFPFYSPRYAAHMVSEQSLPAIAGYFAAMLYNPNNVSNDAAPVTVHMELEASRMIAGMVGFGSDAWAHLTSGGTIANLEALWLARTVRYLPLIIDDMRSAVGLPVLRDPGRVDPLRYTLSTSPSQALALLAATFAQAGPERGTDLINAYIHSPFNPAVQGIAAITGALGSSPAILLPETHHYCFEKCADVLGLGRSALVRIAVDSDFRMNPDDLDRALDRLEAQGRHPLAVIAVAGTTEEGAVDPLDQIIALRARREQSGRSSFWMHIDGAYGAYLRTTILPERLGLGEPHCEVQIGGAVRTIPLHLPEGHTCDALASMGEFDSVAVDPHKLGYIPYPAGCICFKSDLVKPLLRQEAPYLTDPSVDLESERHESSVGLYILEGSKPGAAAAAVWLSHTLIPLNITGHGQLMRETIRNACELHALMEDYACLWGETPGVQAVTLCPPGSNILCYAFRPVSAGGSLSDINQANRRIYHRFTLSLTHRVYDLSFFVSRTTISDPQYGMAAVRPFLARLGVTEAEYQREGVFLLRSVLMNPWYDPGKRHARSFLAEMTAELYRAAREEFNLTGN